MHNRDTTHFIQVIVVALIMGIIFGSLVFTNAEGAEMITAEDEAFAYGLLLGATGPYSCVEAGMDDTSCGTLLADFVNRDVAPEAIRATLEGARLGLTLYDTCIAEDLTQDQCGDKAIHILNKTAEPPQGVHI